MKDTKYYFLCILLWSTLLACSNTVTQWAYDGSVTRGSKFLQTELRNTYSALSVSEGVFLAGYKVDERGINYPYAVLVDNNLTDVTYWAQTQSIQQFFQYQNNVHFLDEAGGVYLYEDDDWQLVDFRFKSNSSIVFSGDYVIACQPAPLMKASAERGNCYSPQKKWQIEVDWSEIVPIICQQRLVVVEDRAEEIVVRQFDMETGLILDTKKVKNMKKDICTYLQL